MSNDTTTVSHYEVKRAELLEDIAAAEAKVAKLKAQLDKLDAAQNNAAAIEALAPGDEVAYVYGRALNKRVLNGRVVAAKKSDKGVVQLKIEHGEGFDAEFHLIDATALLFTSAEVEAALFDIELAKEEAARTADDARRYRGEDEVKLAAEEAQS